MYCCILYGYVDPLCDALSFLHYNSSHSQAICLNIMKRTRCAHDIEWESFYSVCTLHGIIVVIIIFEHHCLNRFQSSKPFAYRTLTWYCGVTKTLSLIHFLRVSYYFKLNFYLHFRNCFEFRAICCATLTHTLTSRQWFGLNECHEEMCALLKMFVFFRLILFCSFWCLVFLRFCCFFLLPSMLV